MALPCLLLFARAPEAGRVKTRLAGRLTEAGAADLYRAFLSDAARLYARPSRWSSVLCADPDPLHPALDSLFPSPWRREAQAGKSLGDRLSAAFDSAFAGGAPAAVAVGSDHPTLPLERLAEVFDRLADGGGDAAIVPAEDGGYCAIGLTSSAPYRDVFREVPWSTPEVLARTVQRLERAGVRYRLLPAAYDVDRPEDLERLRLDLAERDPGAADYPAATARALRTLLGAAP